MAVATTLGPTHLESFGSMEAIEQAKGEIVDYLPETGLAILNGDLGPTAISFGRARVWNGLPDRFFFDLIGELHCFNHPLRRPAEYLRTYQRLWTNSANTAPTVFHP